MEKNEISISEEHRVINGDLSPLFRLLSKPDALKILYHAEKGIENSTYAIEELDLTPKKYYARLRALIDIGLVKKVDGVHKQTALGRMIYDRFLPAMEKAVYARDELEFLAGLKVIEIDDGVRKLIEEELGVPIFMNPTNVKMVGEYESMVVEIIDLCDEAEESILMATNHIDVRVLDAILRSMDRGIKNSFIIGREILSSKLQQLRMILSPKFPIAMKKLTSNSTDLSEIAMIKDIPYSFCVVDRHINMIEISNAPNFNFIVAFSIKDRGIGKKLTDYFEKLWKDGESYSTLKFLSSFKE